MRNLAGVALVALLAILFSLLFLTEGAGKKAAPEAASAPIAQVSFGLSSARLADAGSARVAVLGFYLFPEEEKGELRVFCSEAPLQKNMLILSHASVPGIGAALGEKVAGELSRCGFSSRKASLEDALASENAVIISPTGAIPSLLAENASKLRLQNSRVVALQSLDGRLVSQNGSLSEANGSYGFGTVEIEPGAEAMAAHAAAMMAIIPPDAGAQIALARGGNLTIAVNANGSIAYCRAVYLSSGGACRSSDSIRLESPAGRLKGPSSLLEGEKGVFEFSLANGSEVGRSLRFYASLLDGKKAVARQEIAGGKISDGWASAFGVEAPEGGKYVLSVSDQFGRVHAESYLESLGFSVSEVSRDGARREYAATFGGKPLSGIVGARIDEGEAKQYYSSNGTLVVFAAPSAGRHAIHFSYGALSASQDFAQESIGVLDTYVRLGIPSLAFLAAVFLLLRAGRKTRYRITFPKKAGLEMRQAASTQGELRRAWAAFDRKIGGFSLACTPEEIASELPAIMGERKGTALNLQSVRKALLRLSQGGLFAESEGWFIPRACMKGFTASEACALRLIHDLLLERGIPFQRRRIIRLKGRGLELALFSGKKPALEGIGKGRRAIVFPGKEGLAEFEKSLEAPSEENVRIKLALSNGKLLLAVASRQALERILP
ncbi:Uncharacterised protein [uncultured archaeon]|nr:Uncharacterised protein [uncultured archaeon]